MKIHTFSHRKVAKFMLLASVVITVQGCAKLNTGASHQPIINGVMDEKYSEDLAKCQQVAEQREYLNDETKSDALIGAGVGILAGIADGAGGIVGGALVGASLGTASGAFDTRTERKNIVLICMEKRGYEVLESTGQHN